VNTQSDSASASATQSGHRSWFFIIRNQSGSAVTNATISADSGYSPSLFQQSGKCGPAFSSFPVVVANQAALPSGQELNGGLCSSIPVSFTTGFNSSRSVTPLEVPNGGGDQSVAVSMTLTDSRYAASNIVKVSVLAYDLPGETILCGTASPAPANGAMQCNSNQVNWGLNDQALNVPMQFSVSVHVPNASGHSIWHKPPVWTLGLVVDQPITVSGPATTLVIPDPTLDGGTAGRGAITYSVSETSLTWGTEVSNSYQVSYEPLLSNNDLNLFVSITPPTATNGTNVVASESLTNMAGVSRQVTLTEALYYVSPNGLVPIGSRSSSFSMAPGENVTRQFAFTVTPSIPRGNYQFVATATDVTGTTQQKASFTVN
jgi:hypothetical protein